MKGDSGTSLVNASNGPISLGAAERAAFSLVVDSQLDLQVSIGLLVHQSGQRMRRIPFCAQGFADKLRYIVEPERRQHNFLYIRSGQAPFSTRCRTSGRCVQPLRIVEEQRKRMLWPSERAEEPPEHQPEAGAARKVPLSAKISSSPFWKPITPLN